MEISFESARYLHWSQLIRAEASEGERTLNVVRKVKVGLHQDHSLAVLAGNLPSTFVSKVHTLVVEAVANHVVNIGGQLAILNEKITQKKFTYVYINFVLSCMYFRWYLLYLSRVSHVFVALHYICFWGYVTEVKYL